MSAQQEHTTRHSRNTTRTHSQETHSRSLEPEHVEHTTDTQLQPATGHGTPQPEHKGRNTQLEHTNPDTQHSTARNTAGAQPDTDRTHNRTWPETPGQNWSTAADTRPGTQHPQHSPGGLLWVSCTSEWSETDQ
jgi:hypothetical protein